MVALCKLEYSRVIRCKTLQIVHKRLKLLYFKFYLKINTRSGSKFKIFTANTNRQVNEILAHCIGTTEIPPFTMRPRSRFEL